MISLAPIRPYLDSLVATTTLVLTATTCAVITAIVPIALVYLLRRLNHRLSGSGRTPFVADDNEFFVGFTGAWSVVLFLFYCALYLNESQLVLQACANSAVMIIGSSVGMTIPAAVLLTIWAAVESWREKRRAQQADRRVLDPGRCVLDPGSDIFKAD